ncbi:MAG: hypothetical protein ABGZ35_14475 [Planctomycetaceae bacterium]
MGEAKLIFIVIFMVIALIRAIRNNAPAKPEDKQAGAEAAVNRRRVQSDIDAFLSEVGAAPAQAPARERPTPAPQRARRQETSAQRRQNRGLQQRRQRQQDEGQQGQRQQAPANSRKATSPITERPPGSGISEHVDRYISQHVADHVDSKVDDLVEVDIAHSVNSHLGNRSAELPSLTQAGVDLPTSAATFRKLLRSREGARQAILLNEILARPRPLRR